MSSIEGLHGDPALSIPMIPFGGKYSIDPHLFQHRFDGIQTAIRIRPLTQHFVDEIRVGHGHDGLVSNPELIHRTMLARPLFEDGVEMLQVQLQKISENRQSFRSGKIRQMCGRTMQGPARRSTWAAAAE